MGCNGSPASVTVVIPVWDDYVRFLPEAVTSVRRDAPELPVVVVDNASTATLPDLQRVTVVRTARLTVGASRNLDIEQVETEYVLVLDADDKLLPGTLGFLASGLQADPSVSVCVTGILDAETGERYRLPKPFVPRLSRWPRTFAAFGCSGPSSLPRTATATISAPASSRTVPALRDDGVRALLLKGRSIAGWLYDEPAERPYLDCDLIVAPQHHDRAEAALRARLRQDARRR
jgi:glycosyltransferase involved in cell wall biosynthesis